MSGGGTPGGLPLISRFWLNCIELVNFFELSPILRWGTLILVNQKVLLIITVCQVVFACYKTDSTSWTFKKISTFWPMRYLFRGKFFDLHLQNLVLRENYTPKLTHKNVMKEKLYPGIYSS
jgi:hypothetical protein